MITCFTRWCFHFLFSTPKIGEDEQFDLRFYVFIQKVALKPPTSLAVDSRPFQQTEALIFFGTPSGPSPRWLRMFSGERCKSKWTIDSPKGVPHSLGGWRLHKHGVCLCFSGNQPCFGKFSLMIPIPAVKKTNVDDTDFFLPQLDLSPATEQD